MAKVNNKNIKKSDLEKLSIDELRALDKLIPVNKNRLHDMISVKSYDTKPVPDLTPHCQWNGINPGAGATEQMLNYICDNLNAGFSYDPYLMEHQCTQGFYPGAEGITICEWIGQGHVTQCDPNTQAEIYGDCYDIATTTEFYMGPQACAIDEGSNYCYWDENIGLLTNLIELQFRWNDLVGQAPEPGVDGWPVHLHGLDNLYQLERLNLEGNRFIYGIPPEIGQLRSLKVLNLSNCHIGKAFEDNQNYFPLPLPDWLGQGNMLNLEWLNLTWNNFSGEIPMWIGSFRYLKVLGLGHNNFYGEIPTSIEHMSSLEWINLGNNQLTGEIIPEIGNLTKLWGLGLHDNQLTGDFPSWIPNKLQKLTQLWLKNNQLSGEIPPLGKLKDLYDLNIQSNQFSGQIPYDICDLMCDPEVEVDCGMSNYDFLFFVMLENNKLCPPYPPGGDYPDGAGCVWFGMFLDDIVGYQDTSECELDCFDCSAFQVQNACDSYYVSDGCQWQNDECNCAIPESGCCYEGMRNSSASSSALSNIYEESRGLVNKFEIPISAEYVLGNKDKSRRKRLTPVMSNIEMQKGGRTESLVSNRVVGSARTAPVQTSREDFKKMLIKDILELQENSDG